MTRVIFGIVSAFQRPATVSQLVSALGDRPVVIHHDFNQRPDFAIEQRGVHFVPEPALTGWGTWGFCEAIVRMLEYCFEHVPFDYFQLLSPTCLPLRPIDEFERYLADLPYDGNMDLIALESDPDVLMTFGWRFLAPRGSLKLAALRRARSWYFNHDVQSRHRASLSVLVRSAAPGPGDPRAVVAALATRSSLRGWAGPTPFNHNFRPYVGSCWFGANRALAERIVKAARTPALQKYFQNLPNADESFFPTVVGNSGMRIGPSHHLVNFFNDTGNPHWLRPGDLDRLVASQAYFGRKFPDDPGAAVRLDVLDRVRPAQEAGVAAAARRPGKRRPRIAFGVMSAMQGPATLGQLAEALAPHRLVLNHDFTQQPDFALALPNVTLVERPLKAVQGTWSWIAGVLQLLRHSVDTLEFDYFQLLSPLCLPIRPIDEFAAHVAASDVDAHAAVLEVDGLDIRMSLGARLYAADGTRRRRLLEWARGAYFGHDALRLERAGVPLYQRRMPPQPGREALYARFGAWITQVAGWHPFGLTPPDVRMKLYVGQPWFGATREVCEFLLKQAADPDWLNYFRGMNAGAGDTGFATLLGNSGFRLGPPNHASHPLSPGRRWIVEDDLAALCASGAFFARGFSSDAASPVRLRMLARLQQPAAARTVAA